MPDIKLTEQEQECLKICVTCFVNMAHTFDHYGMLVGACQNHKQAIGNIDKFLSILWKQIIDSFKWWGAVGCWLKIWISEFLSS